MKERYKNLYLPRYAYFYDKMFSLTKAQKWHFFHDYLLLRLRKSKMPYFASSGLVSLVSRVGYYVALTVLYPVRS